MAAVYDHGVAAIFHYANATPSATISLFYLSADSLMRYMGMLTTIIETDIKSLLSDCFAVISDGWSGDDTQYELVLAMVSADWPRGLDNVLQAIVPMGDEDLLSADDQ